MRSFVFWICSFFLFLPFAWTDDFQKADTLFEKGVFQGAMKEYEDIRKTANDEAVQYKAFFRICECLAHLFRYGEAAQKLIETPLPAEEKNKARILILKAELFRNFLMQYGSFQNHDVMDGQENSNVFHLTPEEIRIQIVKTHQLLWEMKSVLVGIPLKEEGYFLNLDKVDFGMFPTLFDYAVFSISNYFVEEASASKEDAKPRPEPFLVREWKAPLNWKDPPLIKTASIFEEAGRFACEKRLEAAERWKIKRLMLPLNQTHLMDFRTLSDDRSVTDNKDYKIYRTRAIEVLDNWLKDLQTSAARAENLFEKAKMLNSDQAFPQAVELCCQIEQEYSDTLIAKKASALKLEIERPVLGMAVRTTLPPAKECFDFTVRNLKTVYLRAYGIDPYKLKEFFIKYNPNWTGQGWDYLLTHCGYDDWFKTWLKHDLLKNQSPSKEWNIKTSDDGTHKYISINKQTPPELQHGIYLILACSDSSFNAGSFLLQTCFLNISDLVLIGTPGFSLKTYQACDDWKTIDSIRDSGCRFYSLNAVTGKCVPGTGLNIHVNRSGPEYKNEWVDLTSDSKGMASLEMPVWIYPYQHSYFNLSPLAKNKSSFSFWNRPLWFNYTPLHPVEIFIEMDRPIYRPGHKVQAKAVVVRRSSHGFKTMEAGKKLTFIARDCNWKEWFKKDNVPVNDFGSASIEFEIPTGKLLGQYTLEASCNEDSEKKGKVSFSRRVSFSVEEYKRPEFEIKLKKTETPWKYNEPVEIKGSAAYYFGGPVPDATVKYRIKKQAYVPWFYRSWFYNSSYGSAQEIASGEVKTDEEGGFSIPFTPPRPQENTYNSQIPEITEFLIEVEAKDSGGRTIECRESYRCGKKSMYFIIDPFNGFDLENNPIHIESKLLTVNDTPCEGKATYEVYSLVAVPATPLGENNWRYQNEWNWVPSLDIQFKDVKNHKRMQKGVIKHDQKGKVVFVLDPLPAGVYRLIERMKDKGETISQEKIFIVAKDAKAPVPVQAFSVTLSERDKYEVGETARFVVGSHLADGFYVLELWAGGYLVKSEFMEKGIPVSLLEVPVTEELKGGFTLRWFGVKNLQFVHGQVTVSVPWKEKKLSVSLSPFSQDMKPGATIKWGLLVRDREGNHVKAEALALMYDRSLEYYRKGGNFWLDDLYALRPFPASGRDSVFHPSVFPFPVTEGMLQKILNSFRKESVEPALPGLRTWRTWAYTGSTEEGLECLLPGGQGNGFLQTASAPVDEGKMKREEEKSSAVIDNRLDRKLRPESQERGIGKDHFSQDMPPEVQTRKAFSDTAFFIPHLVTDKDGSASFSFVSPEQLTSWKVKVWAFNQDVCEGSLEEEAVTKKDLMVRADIPRFFREKDCGTVTAVIHNETDREIQGSVVMDIREKNISVNQKLKLTNPGQQFTVKPHGLTACNWKVEIPEGVSQYKVKVAAVSSGLSDAEERDLPILPSRERLIESAFAALSGNVSKKLEIKLPDDKTRINESMVLQVEPQLALTLLNAIPFLVQYPHECVEQLLNKYVPLSVMNQIYQTYPNLKNAVSKIPRRSTPSPQWEKEDPNRLIALMETPWIYESEGRPSVFPVIDLLNPEVVEKQKQINLDKLRSAQLSSGAFPWWPGGRDDPYITLYVLAGFAEARRYGVEVPLDVVSKALNYINSTIPLRLKPEEEALALISYAAYVVTSFSIKEFPEAKIGIESAKAWVVFLEKHLHSMTPFGKAYLAFTLLRLGAKEKADSILDMALDGSREDPIVGVYWTPEKFSWIWYSDTVEKHAFFLKTLQELRPEDKRIPGMVQWLLFNRKGCVWKSTKASSAAVFSLLGYLSQTGALDKDESFTIQWGQKKDKILVKADDFLDKPLRWQEKGFEIGHEQASATIEKEGPGFAFASLTWTYSTNQVPFESAPGLLELHRAFFLRVKEGDKYHLKPIKSGGEVSVGDQIEVHLKVNTRSRFEYMHLKDPKAAGFEAENLLSGWKWEPLWCYEEPRDSLTNFFFDRIPHGEYVLKYRLKPTKPGTYRVGAATLQSMYAPEMTAHSAGFKINVKE
ncbi:MAG: hypothetical protein JW774_03505 [Candidatus Aureabacteria bacterium]|nr:hypothetical protein [Candidatus Auribacterota bacterium]